MTLVTDIIQNYRLALRDLWNTYFYADPLLRDGGLTGDFEYLVPCLFESLVSRRLEYNRVSPGELFGPDFKVRPRLDTLVPNLNLSIPNLIHTLQVDIGFEDKPGRRWIKVPGHFKADEITLSAVNFFDWMPNYWRDFRYILVLIERLQQHPEYEGKQGIVEFEEVEVIWVHERIGDEIITTGDPPRILD